MKSTACSSADQDCRNDSAKLRGELVDSTSEYAADWPKDLFQELDTSVDAFEEAISRPPVDELPPADPILAGFLSSSDLVIKAEEPPAPSAVEPHSLPTRLKEESRPAKPTLNDADLGNILLPPERGDEIGRLGPYRVLSILGAGGMGVVFQAEDPQLKRFVALKVMQPGLAENEIARQRFLREARATAALAHDNIVAIHQVGEDRGIPYFVMPLLEGETLDVYLERLPVDAIMPINDTLRIAKEIADGLAAAHERGVIHRDVKPSNIWLEGERRRVKIVDFGLARERYSDVRLTQTGKVVGTPGYMAPEQVENKPVDQRSDLFSLGCLLYLMATGRDAFHGETTFDTLRAVVQDEPAPIPASKKLPADFISLVMRLLSKKPGDRPLSAMEVSKTLQSIRKRLAKGATKHKSPETAPDALPVPELSGKSRNLGAIVIVGGFTLGLAAATIWLAPWSKKPEPLHIEDIVIDKHETPAIPAEVVPPAPTLALPATPVPAPAAKQALTDERWVAEKAKLPTAKRLQAVTQRLKELNPDYDGDYTRIVDANNAITRFVISTDHVRVIWPIRALTDLNGLHLNGSGPGKGMLRDLSALKGMRIRNLEISNNAIADFSPLKEMPLLETLRCQVSNSRDAHILQSLTTLRRINDRPAGQFWKETAPQAK